MTDEHGATPRYEFRFADGRTKVLQLPREGPRRGDAGTSAKTPPAWTALEFEQCPNCPLQPQERPRCPAALSLVEGIEQFGDIISYEEADVRIETPERTYEKHTSMQEAVSSLMGLNLANSGCPILARLQPMAHTHLPFSTVDETQYRVLSMYLLAQYFRAQDGQEADWALRDLKALYEEIRVVNESLARRLGDLPIEDTNRNAIAILDAFAAMVSFSIDHHRLDRLRRLFTPYLP